MFYIYLPGNSTLNKDEKDMFQKAFKAEGVDHYAHEYAHWEDESLEYDKDREVEAIQLQLDSKLEDEYGIFCKSIGTYTAVELISEMEQKPEFIVFMGIPTGIGEKELARFQEVLQDLDTAIYLIQNDNDPYGPLEEVYQVLDGLDYEEMIIEDNDTHRYPYVDGAMELINV